MELQKGTKDFHLSDILSITTSKLVSLRHIEGVYDILNFMTGSSLFTHALPRASEECRPFLLEQHPWLSEISGDEVNTENWREWVDSMVAQYGEYFPVSVVPKDGYRHLDIITEYKEMTRREIS